MIAFWMLTNYRVLSETHKGLNQPLMTFWFCTLIINCFFLVLKRAFIEKVSVISKKYKTRVCLNICEY